MPDTVARADDSHFKTDGRAAWLRLVLSLILGATACVGTWSAVVALPVVEAEFGSLRSGSSLAYTCAMLGFASGAIVLGQVADRLGFRVPIQIGAVC